MTTFASLFAGGGLADAGAMMAGLTPIWSVERDAGIAKWHRRNIPGRCLVEDMREVDFAALPSPDVLWASPPCTSSSVANSNRGETEEDKESALAVCRALSTLLPRWFVLENVMQYDDTESFATICRTLDRLGYWWEHGNLNSADFQVPQTRRRLILRASLGSMLPPLPMPLPWIGWYEAIEDLLPSCPPSQFAPWQLKRLPAELTTLLAHATADNDRFVTREAGNLPRALLMQPQGEGGDGYRSLLEPAPTVTTCHGAGKYRAFLLAGGNSSNKNCIQRAEAPSFTVVAGTKHPPKAFLVCGTPNDTGQSVTTLPGSSPSFVVPGSAAKQMPRAFLFKPNGSNGDGQGTDILLPNDPAGTVAASHNSGEFRSFTGHRVVKLTPRCLARFQSVPDSYELPDKGALACKIIGNGVPCLLAATILRPMRGE